MGENTMQMAITWTPACSTQNEIIDTTVNELQISQLAKQLYNLIKWILFHINYFFVLETSFHVATQFNPLGWKTDLPLNKLMYKKYQNKIIRMFADG